MLLGFKPNHHAGELWDYAEKLPNGVFLIHREIENAVSGKKYILHKFEDGSEKAKPQHMDAVQYDQFIEYYELWENFHYFGYPNGLSWLEACPWFNTILKRFENTFTQVQNMKDEAAMKK